MTASAFPHFLLHLEAKEKPGLMESAVPPPPPPRICHRCGETSLPTRRAQQDISSSLVTSPSLSVICKRPGLNCRFASRLGRTHAATARLSQSLPWCRGVHFWQAGDAGELADVKHIHGSHALNSTFFFKGGCWEVGQSSGVSLLAVSFLSRLREPAAKYSRSRH